LIPSDAGRSHGQVSAGVFLAREVHAMWLSLIRRASEKVCHGEILHTLGVERGTSGVWARNPSEITSRGEIEKEGFVDAFLNVDEREGHYFL
jgi:hypothetical protein